MLLGSSVKMGTKTPEAHLSWRRLLATTGRGEHDVRIQLAEAAMSASSYENEISWHVAKGWKILCERRERKLVVDVTNQEDALVEVH